MSAFDPERMSTLSLFLDRIRPDRIERQYEDRGPTAQGPGSGDSYWSNCRPIRKPGSVAEESDDDER